MLLSSKGYADSVGKTTQMSYAVYPKNAFDNGVTWSIAAGTGSATIDKVSGLLKATGIGTVTVTATANDGSGKTASTVVKIGTRLTKIKISGVGGASTITTPAGSLQLSYTVTPKGGIDTTVIWSLIRVGTAKATISISGLVSANADGTIKAIAATNDGSGKTDTLTITISNQIIPFDLVTFKGDVPAGASIVDILGKKFLKIRVSAWNTAFKVATLTTNAYSTYKFSYIYKQDTSSVAPAGVQAFIQFINKSWGNKITITDKPASTTEKILSGNLKADTISMLQLAVHKTSGSWSAVAGSILYISQMQITTPFDLSTFVGVVPAGDTIVTINGAKYLKVRVNAWSNAFPIAPMTFYKTSSVSFSYKYDKDTTSIVASSVQAFVQFMKAGATAENIAVTDNPASEAIKKVTAALRADIVNQLQLACQQNASPWGAKAGPILYIGQMTFTAPFDLVSFTGDIPTGATIVNSTSIKYLKIRINSWNTAFPVAKMIFVKNDKVQFKYKYSQDTSQITASSVQAFFQFMLSGATAENITVTDNPASTIVKSITATLRSDTINQLQLACQQNASPWRAKAGPILYVSQMTFTMPTMVTGIAISGGTAITTAAGTLSVIATVTPTGATDNTVTWSVDKPAIATIDAKTGKLTAVSNGSVVVTATANDGLKVMATATIVVSGQVSVTTLTAANIGLYPNPVIDVLHLSNTASVNKVEIFNTNGQLVLMLTNTSGQMDINTMSLNNGVYILRAYTNNNVIMKQLVK